MSKVNLKDALNKVLDRTDLDEKVFQLMSKEVRLLID